MIKNFHDFLNESINDTYSAKKIAEYVYNRLSDEQKENNDWDFEEYYNTIKSFGDKYKLININPSELKFNEDFDKYTIEEYEDKLNNGEKLPPIVIDKHFEIIDGNHRAKASLNLNKNIDAYVAL